MMLDTISYLNLSKLVYGNFKSKARGHSIDYIIKNKLYTNTEGINIDDPELFALKDPSNPLLSYTLIHFEKKTTFLALLARLLNLLLGILFLLFAVLKLTRMVYQSGTTVLQI